MPGIRGTDRLVLIGRTQGGRGFTATSFPDYADLRSQSKTFEQIAVQQSLPLSLAQAGRTGRVSGAAVSGNYFDALHTRIAQGQGFSASVDRGGSSGAATPVSSAPALR